MLLRWTVTAAFAALVALPGSAQTFETQLKAGAQLSRDLAFPSEPKELSLFSNPEMAIYKPAGTGPFPAVVLLHSCGGVRSEILEWAKRSLDKGYVVFVLDSLGPRGLKSNCYPPTTVYPSRGVRDVFQAREHLKKFPFVDANRIALIGFSFGATVTLIASNSEGANALSVDGGRFNAAVAFYPMCNFPGTPKYPGSYEYLRQTTDKPLLVLMGEADNETPPSECLPRLDALKAKGAPVESHLYPATTHCWDCESNGGKSKIDFLGNAISYRYDRAVTDDSARRTFEFLESKMPATKN